MFETGPTLYSWGLKLAFGSRSLQRKKLQSVSPKIKLCFP